MEALEDFERALKNVDKISELVKDLNSSDADTRQKAIKEADCYIASMDEPCRTKINKTKINTSSTDQPSFGPQSESPESFIKNMERDAEDRRQRRIAQQKKALVLKDKGNKAYADGDYESAVKCYSDGLAELRDMQQLYTNRAQSYIKLGKHKEAISDCEWALKCNDRCIKAYFHMGKAYLELKDYSESRRCFEKIAEIEPGRKKMVEEHVTQVDMEEERETQEVNAKHEFDKGERKGTAVPEVLKKLSKPGQMTLFYCGGLQILLEAVSDSTGQTLFRLNNGFSIICRNDTVKRCLLEKTKDKHSQRLCVSVLKLWRVICDGNAENQKMLLKCPVTRQAAVDLIASESVAVQRECLSLLHLFAQMPHGRQLVIESLDVHVLVRNLMACISKQQQENMAVNVLENFAAEKKLFTQLRNVLTDSVIEPLTTILRNISESNRHVLPSLISAIGCLAQDDVIRHQLAHDSECWKAFLFSIRHCSAHEFKEILYPVLGLIISLSTVTSPAVQEHSLSLCDFCQGLLRDTDGGVITRAIGVLSTVLPQSSEAVERVIQKGVVRTMYRLLKRPGQTASKYAMKTLTVCTAASHLARQELVKCDKKLSILRHLLASSCDDMVSGNATLCLTHCLQLERVASSLLDTDIVLLLLRRAAGDTKRTAVQQNAAIALGKLCQAEPRHLNRLRELHGFEVLHSCMKFIT
ncbi:tetratricopeptide repeat protein 12 [Solea senegalensis]|uniref:Tetratricopeptide repeat protein 12 n=1 Tax=Solea senegalensis TaxID=28829 RepID=A0AAV6S8D0_SOLSE|nr:tetratricopeptide repeat protein 12-like [Solea senegalensis]KAG7513873.1 tetratricopeptide repeat protein 12 [Solea senegalensis]